MTPGAETYTGVIVGVLLGVTGLCIAGAPWSALVIACAVATPAYFAIRHLDSRRSS